MLTCPICGGELHVTKDSIVCEHCRTGVDLQNRTILVSENVPEFILESWIVFKLILTNRVTIAASKAQLFTEAFSLKDTVLYADVSEYDENAPDILIGYCGVPAILFKSLLLSYKRTEHCLLSVLDDLNPDTLLSTWFMSEKRDASSFGYDEQKVLSTILAPTWVDCAEAAFDNSLIDPMQMSESELLYCGMTCNKFPMLVDVAFKDALPVIKDFLLQQSKFVHDNNPRLYRWNKPIDAALKDICPELNVVNTHKDSTFVDWLFATSTPWLISEKEAEPMRKPFRLLWERYGSKYSVASKTINLLYQTSNAVTYMRYWQKMRTRLQR